MTEEPASAPPGSVRARTTSARATGVLAFVALALVFSVLDAHIGFVLDVCRLTGVDKPISPYRVIVPRGSAAQLAPRRLDLPRTPRPFIVFAPVGTAVTPVPFPPLRKHTGEVWDREELTLAMQTDGQTLVIDAVASDREPGRLLTSHTTASRRGGLPYKDDGLEFFFCAAPDAPYYYQVCVSCSGGYQTYTFENVWNQSSMAEALEEPFAAKPTAAITATGYQIHLEVKGAAIGAPNLASGGGLYVQVIRNYRGQAEGDAVTLQLFPVYVYADRSGGFLNHHRRAFRWVSVFAPDEIRLATAGAAALPSPPAAPPADAAVLHVAPTGRADGDGSVEHPLDLARALGDASPARPGTTLLLAAGDYAATAGGDAPALFAASVNGTPAQPITVRPAPGAVAAIRPGVRLTGSHLRLWDLELGAAPPTDVPPSAKRPKTPASKPSNTLAGTDAKPKQAPSAVEVVEGTDSALVNCNVFGGRCAITIRPPARRLTVYGCLLHDQDPREEGPALELLAPDGLALFRHNLVWHGAGPNLHAGLPANAGSLGRLVIGENVFAVPGIGMHEQSIDNVRIAGQGPVDRAYLEANVLYQPLASSEFRPNARVSAYQPVRHGALTIRGNWFAGGAYGLSLAPCRYALVQDNDIWAVRRPLELNSAPTGSSIRPQPEDADAASYDVQANRYYLAEPAANVFVHARQEHPDDDELLTFAAWQARGFDRNGQVGTTRDGHPTGTVVRVFPNGVTPGRGVVAVLNWDGLAETPVDLAAVLAPNQAYAIYHFLDLRTMIAAATPVVTGTCTSAPVFLPLRRDLTSPHFDAFLVLPR